MVIFQGGCLDFNSNCNIGWDLLHTESILPFSIIFPYDRKHVCDGK